MAKDKYFIQEAIYSLIDVKSLSKSWIFQGLVFPGQYLDLDLLPQKSSANLRIIWVIIYIFNLTEVVRKKKR